MKLFLFPYLRYKFANAYVDKLGNMYLVSTSRSKKLGSTEIDYINVLEYGYLDFELQEKLIEISWHYNQGYVITPTEKKKTWIYTS